MSAADQRSLFVRYWFLIALGATFVCGWMLFDWLPPGVVASIHDASGVRTATVTTVMLMLCVSMPTRRAMDALRHPAAGVVGTCLNLMVPMLAIAIWPLHLVAPQWLPREALQGIYVACLVPSTLASGSVWTHRAGGDDSISMWVTLATNGLCCVVVPFWLWVGVASGLLGSPVQDPLTVTDSVSIAGATDAAVTGVSWTTQFWKLACMVLLPLVLGQCLRRIGLAGIADRFKRQISFLAQIGILCIVLLGTIGLRLNLDADANLLQDIAGLVLVLIVVAGIHTLVLWMGIQISAAIGCSQEKQIAVGISGSQKTLMIGLQIAIDAGASLLPMMLYHACQLLIDTPIADAWRRRHSDSQSPSNVPSSSNPLPTTDAPHPNHPTPP